MRNVQHMQAQDDPGSRQEIEARLLMRGDVLLIEEGEPAPAGGRAQPVQMATPAKVPVPGYRLGTSATFGLPEPDQRLCPSGPPRTMLRT